MVHLNVSPGLVPVDDILRAVLDTIAVEAAAVMQPDDDQTPDIFDTFRDMLGGLLLQPLTRQQFYATACGPDIAVAVA